MEIIESARLETADLARARLEVCLTLHLRSSVYAGKDQLNLGIEILVQTKRFKHTKTIGTRECNRNALESLINAKNIRNPQLVQGSCSTETL